LSDSHYDEKTDEILGITRCARCGHRLEGEVDCPFCAAMRGLEGPARERPARRTPLWVYMTAILLSFPLSIPWILTSRRLNFSQKMVALAVGVLWMSTVIWFL
jgi:hypothetical protein